MSKHWKYLSYVVRHKWFVLLAGLKIKAGIWRLLVHDLSKFAPREFFPYASNFFNDDGTPRKVRDASGAYDPNSQAERFKMAWLSHQRNKHHWQAWVSIGDGGNLSVMPMPEKYVREMVADWMGAGRVITGKWEAAAWYAKNRNKILIHDFTRLQVEILLGIGEVQR